MDHGKKDNSAIAEILHSGKAYLGIELGSTRIKSSLIDSSGTSLASGSFEWENSYLDGYWTYGLEEIWHGIASCHADLKTRVQSSYGLTLKRLAGIGISAMMHGYLAFDGSGNLLVPFRTWRNSTTGDASRELAALFNFPVPQRWSVAHLHQAILNNEKHISEVSFLSSLAGYVHWKLTGKKVTGVGDASGIFPIDPATAGYSETMLKAYEERLAEYSFNWSIRTVLPDPVPAGIEAGRLSPKGALLLDPSGDLETGILFCPPEGDAETGMVATNSIREKTGNVSAGTSVFAMIVLEHPLSRAHEEIDIVMTPDAKPVGMVHSNNCSSDFDAWMSVFAQVGNILGAQTGRDELYAKLMPLALQGDDDADGMLAVSYVSGEHITGFEEGRPLIARMPEKPLRIENILRSLLFSAFCTLRKGLNVLIEEEGISISEIRAHGGIFRTPIVAQRILSAVLNTAVSIPECAGEGGSWGMAILAAFTGRENREEKLADFLDRLLADKIGEALLPESGDIAGFNRFFTRYIAGLSVEKEAVKVMR